MRNYILLGFFKLQDSGSQRKRKKKLLEKILSHVQAGCDPNTNQHCSNFGQVCKIKLLPQQHFLGLFGSGSLRTRDLAVKLVNQHIMQWKYYLNRWPSPSLFSSSSPRSLSSTLALFPRSHQIHLVHKIFFAGKESDSS